MKFVALVSGGKDSFFNVLHCLKQGHELVALANLHPADKSQQELDSYMFQTVGHDIVPLYSQCTGLPLFRKEIKPAGSINVDLNYRPTVNDEIEDLYQLLFEVHKKIPDIQAVSVGAILSSYQRTRVEDVCGRLGLIVLSYLWQRDQTELMCEMCLMSSTEKDEDASGKLEARLIKVAAIGLDQSSLGKNLPEVLPILKRLHRIYDVHICGEGGEFETIVLDAPFFLKGRLRLMSQDLAHQKCNDGVYNSRLNVEFEERQLSRLDLQRHLNMLPSPKVFDAKWQEFFDRMKNLEINKPLLDESSLLGCSVYKCSVNRVGDLLFISNLYSNEGTLEEQTERIFEQLQSSLREYSITPSRAVFCSLVLADMSFFIKVNEIYSRYFNIWKNGPLPPARTCVASRNMVRGCLVQLSAVLDVSCENEPYRNKSGLHVQSRSYWAPSNIGPYSQATWLQNDPNKVAFISGQIALEPASMQLANKDSTIQSILSLRHFDTLKNTIESKKQLCMVCFASKNYMVSELVRMWSLYCTGMTSESDLWMNKEDDIDECLIILKVPDLPKGALCEWSGVTCRELVVDEDDSDEKFEEFFSRISLGDVKNITVSNANHTRHFMTGFADTELCVINILKQMPKDFKMTLFFNPGDISPELLALGNVEFFPVEKVYDYKGNSKCLAYHIVI
ncbi:related to Putative ribonuclease YLR143W [Zygosaccharomyces bailii ISA1307]|nr:related to Putative ribonuclease YLR143W [Zygosaccharomyces bailii ISA1307]